MRSYIFIELAEVLAEKLHIQISAMGIDEITAVNIISKVFQDHFTLTMVEVERYVDNTDQREQELFFKDLTEVLPRDILIKIAEQFNISNF